MLISDELMMDDPTEETAHCSLLTAVLTRSLFPQTAAKARKG